MALIQRKISCFKKKSFYLREMFKYYQEKDLFSEEKFFDYTRKGIRHSKEKVLIFENGQEKKRILF